MPELFLAKSRKTVWDKRSKFLPIVDLKFVELSDFYSSTRGTLGNRKKRIKRSKCWSTSGENKWGIAFAKYSEFVKIGNFSSFVLHFVQCSYCKNFTSRDIFQDLLQVSNKFHVSTCEITSKSYCYCYCYVLLLLFFNKYLLLLLSFASVQQVRRIHFLLLSHELS